MAPGTTTPSGGVEVPGVGAGEVGAGAGVLGAGVLGAGVLGAGVLGTGVLGAGMDEPVGICGGAGGFMMKLTSRSFRPSDLPNAERTTSTSGLPVLVLEPSAFGALTYVGFVVAVEMGIATAGVAGTLGAVATTTVGAVGTAAVGAGVTAGSCPSWA
jgi:hypothetical protein